MNEIDALHTQAMLLADQVDLAAKAGRQEDAIRLAYEASRLEATAAEKLDPIPENEPTRSILFNSAASLALQAEQFSLAERLFHNAMLGFPPNYIARHLREIYDKVQFAHHLETKGVVLEKADVQLSLDGSGIAPGFIFYSTLKSKLNTLESLFRRTYFRLLDMPWGDMRIKTSLPPFFAAVSVPRAASFAVTVRLARPLVKGQKTLPVIEAETIINEVLDSINLLNDEKEELLRNRIGGEAYFTHFMYQSRELAPDGENIRTVGLTSTEKSIAFRRKRESMVEVQKPLSIGPDQNKEEPLVIKGTLDTARYRNKTIVLVAESGAEYKIKVKEGMEDLVRSCFGRSVKVTGFVKSKPGTMRKRAQQLEALDIQGED